MTGLSAADTPAGHGPLVEELIGLALRGLPAMQLPSGLFCHEVSAPDLRPRGRSLRYTTMVLIGLLRAEAAGRGHGLDRAAIEGALWSHLHSSELTPGDLGLLIWADARSGASRAEETVHTLARALESAGGFASLEGMEVAWIVTGLALHPSASGDRELGRILDDGLRELLHRRLASSGLLYHYGRPRWRRRFPHFATEIYGVLALTAARGCHERALPAARRLADRLLERQRSDGGWPWIFDARAGRVVEHYQLYSVHQDAMAPMALLALHEATGDERYRDAVWHGLEWLSGRNALARPLVARERGVVWRSIRRRRSLDRLLLYASTAAAVLSGPVPLSAEWGLEIDRTDRPYHLGWVLEAWCGREDVLDVPVRSSSAPAPGAATR